MMAIIISIGKWGGVWGYKGAGWCVCLGWVTFMVIPTDIDNIFHLASLSVELSLALEVASTRNANGGWHVSSPFQDIVDDLLISSGRKDAHKTNMNERN